MSSDCENAIVSIYDDVRDLWAALSFDYDTMPDSCRRSAHALARETLDDVLKRLAPIATPIINAEYREAVARARAEQFPCTFSYHQHATRTEAVACAIPRRMDSLTLTESVDRVTPLQAATRGTATTTNESRERRENTTVPAQATDEPASVAAVDPIATNQAPTSTREKENH